MKKKIFFLGMILPLVCESIEYIDREVVTLYRVLSGNHVVKLGIDPLNGDSCFNDEACCYKRRFGIHNMQIIVKGYEPVDLIKHDICYYPKLFTLIAHAMPADNPIVQRWSCVKYIQPLSFTFKVEPCSLTISSSVYRWKSLAPFLTQEIISLKPVGEILCDKKSSVNVIVNGKSVELQNEILVLKNAY